MEFRMIKQAVVPTQVRSNNELAQLEKQVETQNKEYYRVYEYLVKFVSPKDQIQILNDNLQLLPEHIPQVSIFHWIFFHG